MSADNWARCPKCLDRAHEQVLDLQAKVNASYGEVSIEEFDRLRSELSRRAIDLDDPTSFQTLREEYEFHGAEQGKVTAAYGAGCTVCGLSASFSHSQVIWEQQS
ncbi:hypothetical protein [Phycicoccus avicenniae]|uniref:hypothetical protein n=1 Tax=Phycicoccus avicenniae TaxID=2828860 RepID=UPI003D2E9201